MITKRWAFVVLGFFSFLRFYLFIHERHRERQREKQAPCQEPDAGPDPRTGVTPWAEGRRSTAEPHRSPCMWFFFFFEQLFNNHS